MKNHTQLKTFSATACRLLLIGAIGVMASGMSEAAPHDDIPGHEILVNHVRLEGSSMEKFHQDLRRYMADTCAAMGKPVQAPKEGVPVSRVDYDLYYSATSITTYIHTDIQQISPACEPFHNKTTEVEILSSSGLCQVSPGRKVARGNCDIPRAGVKRIVPTRSGIVATGETLTLANEKCKVFAGKYAILNTEYCIAPAPNGFNGFAASWHAENPGVILKLVNWADTDRTSRIVDVSAKEVQFSIKVSHSVMAPHVDGGYQVLGIKPAKHGVWQ